MKEYERVKWHPENKLIFEHLFSVSDLGLDMKRRVELLEVNEPPSRKPGEMVEDVDSLVNKLKNEAKVIWKL